MILHITTTKINFYGVPDTWVCTYIEDNRIGSCGVKAIAKLMFKRSTTGFDAACTKHLPNYIDIQDKPNLPWMWLNRLGIHE